MRVNDAVIGALLVVFGGAVLVYIRNFPTLEEGYPGPALFPKILSILFIVAGLALIVQGAKSRLPVITVDRGRFTPRRIINVAFVLGVVVFYIYVSEPLGFILTTAIILFALTKWLRVPIVQSLIVTVGVTLVIYTLFAKLLLVPLPWGILGW
jgi:putative tricarboxylic transport membrane protein